MKRILVISDLHCGHLVGLTPPSWQTNSPESDGRTKRAKFAPIQREAWKWYAKNVLAGGPYDLVVVNGDAIDGRGDRSGGTEQITTDRQEQVDMACVAIRQAMVGKPKVVMTYGTSYHTGDQEDWENDIAKELKAEIDSQLMQEVEGVIFNFKHFHGGSQVPTGRTAALERAAIWDILCADQQDGPRTDVLVRSHVHYCKYCGDVSNRPYLRLTTPALQASGTRFGSRRCEGSVDFGFVIFEVHRGEVTRFEPVTAKLKSQATTVLTL